MTFLSLHIIGKIVFIDSFIFSQYGFTPLHLSSQNGDNALVRVLTNHPGVRIDAVTLKMVSWVERSKAQLDVIDLAMISCHKRKTCRLVDSRFVSDRSFHFVLIKRRSWYRLLLLACVAGKIYPRLEIDKWKKKKKKTLTRQSN